MRYYYEPDMTLKATKAETYECNALLYKKCTLYRDGKKGLAVIQQRYSKNLRATFFSPIDPWLVDPIFHQERFPKIMSEFAAEPGENGLYPVIELRSLMWFLRMKPLRKEPWETSQKLHII